MSFLKRQAKDEPQRPGHQAERRPLPPQLRAEAARNPGGSVAEIDGRQVTDPNGYVPAEAVVGVYPVDEQGAPTGWFLRNPNHGPVQDDFSLLTTPDHWLGWLPSEPAEAIRDQLLVALTEQVEGATLEWVKVTAAPAFLTGGLCSADDPDKMTVVRAGLAASFALSVNTAARREILTGTFTWVAHGLHQQGQRRDRTWFDIGLSSEAAAAALSDGMFFDASLAGVIAH